MCKTILDLHFPLAQALAMSLCEGLRDSDASQCRLSTPLPVAPVWYDQRSKPTTERLRRIAVIQGQFVWPAKLLWRNVRPLPLSAVLVIRCIG